MPSRRRRAQAPDLDRHAGARRRRGPHGAQQPRDRVEGRHARPVPLAPHRVERLPRPALSRQRDRRPARGAAAARAAGSRSYSPDGQQLAYNRVFREFRTWKRYRGGMADDVWLYDFKTKATTDLTNNPAQDIIPMWKGNKIYFLSDRDEPLPDEPLQLRPRDEADQEAHELHRLRHQVPLARRHGHRVRERRLHLPLRPGHARRPRRCRSRSPRTSTAAAPALVDVSHSVTNFEIAPDGSRALFGARGDVFTVPAKYGPTRNLTHTPGVHERNSKWSPDGRWIAYVSDATGEDEISIVPQDGRGRPSSSPRAATTTSTTPSGRPTARRSCGPTGSSGSSSSTSTRRRSRLVVESPGRRSSATTPGRPTASGSPTRSPRTRRWAGSSSTRSTRSRRRRSPTAGSPSADPVFSATASCSSSSRPRFNPTYGQTEFEHVYSDMSKIYFVTLAKDTKSPLAPAQRRGEDQGRGEAADAGRGQGRGGRQADAPGKGRSEAEEGGAEEGRSRRRTRLRS